MLNINQMFQKFCSSGIGRTAFAALCAHSVSISVGICQGYSAILIPQLGDEVTTEESSWLASLGAVSNPLGSIISGILADHVGRKRAMQISSFPFLVGWACLGVANNIWWLYVGRLITGIAAGMSTASYAYVAEISLPEHRGPLQALGPISASFGIFVTYTLGYLLNWHLVAFISVSFCIITFISIIFIPESPAYLCRKGQREQSLSALTWLRRNSAMAEEECSKMAPSSCAEEPEKKVSFKELYLSSATLKPFFILVFLFLCQEVSGIYTILYYAVNFFQDSNLEMNEYIASIVVGAIRFIMSMVAAVLVNKYFRRTLCMWSSAGMGITMLLAASYFKYYEINSDETRQFALIPLICVLFNVFFSMLGMLPIPWMLVGEMFPVEVRSIMCGLVICIAQIFIFISVQVYNTMNYYLNFSGTLFVFFVASFASLFFCKFILPETKGKTLEEIQSYFLNKKPELHGVDNNAYVVAVGDFEEPKNETSNGDDENVQTIKMSS
ncbi:facilitated trehalose transporter Tret1 [Agrilus planipennis]|uniref:Facilitated trehalose transporter Tret1 n=1 Tax=Agrilus planipennis TaxID=224129 RepID=A0A7F5RE48_AGRPL|nr:facilitated trehalose transporter Tret1 [Agrilus planipennis]